MLQRWLYVGRGVSIGVGGDGGGGGSMSSDGRISAGYSGSFGSCANVTIAVVFVVMVVAMLKDIDGDINVEVVVVSCFRCVGGS